jgi:hypothetical protein
MNLIKAQNNILNRMIEGLRPGSSKTRTLSLLAKYNIFDKKLIQQKLKQLEGDNVLLFTTQQPNQGS